MTRSSPANLGAQLLWRVVDKIGQVRAAQRAGLSQKSIFRYLHRDAPKRFEVRVALRDGLGIAINAWELPAKPPKASKARRIVQSADAKAAP